MPKLGIIASVGDLDRNVGIAKTPFVVIDINDEVLADLFTHKKDRLSGELLAGLVNDAVQAAGRSLLFSITEHLKERASEQTAGSDSFSFEENTGEEILELRMDGPTLEEYVAAGYSADTYPPKGYAAKTSAVTGDGSPITIADPVPPEEVPKELP